MKKIESFQFLRIIAVILVFLSHCERLININGENVLKYLGATGVSIFIALSGFLAAWKYSDTTLNGIELVKKRWKQFYKPHFIGLLLTVPFTIAFLKKSPERWLLKLLLNASFLHAFIPLQSVYFSFNAVSWYLSLAIAFAFFTPIAVKMWNYMSIKSVVIFSILVFLIEIMAFLILGESRYYHWLTYVFPCMRFRDFLLGGAYSKVALYIQKRGMYRLNIGLLVSSITVLVFLMILSVFAGNGLFNTALWTLPSTVLVTALFNIDICVSNRILRLANLNLEFFLMHQIVIRYITAISNRMSIFSLWIYLVAFCMSIIGAYLLYRIERYLEKGHD